MRTPSKIAPVAGRTGLVLGALAAAAFALPAGAAAATVVSTNWAGYVAHTISGRGFQSVSASWIAPAASCRAGRETHSAVWVGLGGYSEDAKALEQIGTDSDCSAAGRAGYSSWVELLPAAASTLRLKVSAGDRITASVTVLGHDATLRLRDLTTGKRYSTTRRLNSVDVSTADWIVEAPSGCAADGGCQTLALSDFSSVAFSNATATAAGHNGTIADPAWTTTELLLDQDGASASGAGDRPLRTLVSATPSAYLGGSFSVTYGETAGQRAPGAPTLPGFAGGA
jgi:hypothetical protein